MNARPAGFDVLEHLWHEQEHPPFHALLKPQAVAADAASGQVIIRLPFSPTLLGAAGADFVHRGVIATLIDPDALLYAVGRRARVP
jgi:acyl-coenzyme A thioesterase PaaI-like protein